MINIIYFIKLSNHSIFNFSDKISKHKKNENKIDYNIMDSISTYINNMNLIRVYNNNKKAFHVFAVFVLLIGLYFDRYFVGKVIVAIIETVMLSQYVPAFVILLFGTHYESLKPKLID